MEQPQDRILWPPSRAGQGQLSSESAPGSHSPFCEAKSLVLSEKRKKADELAFSFRAGVSEPLMHLTNKSNYILRAVWG